MNGNPDAEQAYQTIAGTNIVNRPIPFQAHSLRVDNATNQYAFVPGTGVYILPYELGKVVSLSGTQVANIQFVPPPTGAAQYAIDTSQILSATWLAKWQNDIPGNMANLLGSKGETITAIGGSGANSGNTSVATTTNPVIALGSRAAIIPKAAGLSLVSSRFSLNQAIGWDGAVTLQDSSGKILENYDCNSTAPTAESTFVNYGLGSALYVAPLRIALDATHKVFARVTYRVPGSAIPVPPYPATPAHPWAGATNYGTDLLGKCLTVGGLPVGNVDRTIEIWNRSNNDFGHIIFGMDGTFIFRNSGAFLRLDDSGSILNSSTNIDDNSYRHFVAVHTASDNTTRLYVNGVATGESLVISSYIGTPSQISAFGNTVAGPGNGCQYAAIYNTALTPARVAAHYANRSGGNYEVELAKDNPILVWRLGNDAVNNGTISDITGSGYDGTYGVNVGPDTGIAGPVN